MAIQMRRGSYSDFVPSRMLAGEFAVMTADDPNTANGKSVYMAIAPSDVQRLLTETDLGDMTDAAERAEAAIEAIGDISELAVPLMTEDVRGGAKLGAGLAVVDDTLSLSGESYTSAEKTKLAGIEAGANDYTLPVASPSTLGGVKPDGTTITIEPDGTIHGASTYELPTMDATTKGGAKLGNGLRVDDGALSVGNLVHSGSGAEVVTDGCALYSVDGEGWSEQDGTPTPENPQEIRVCRGRNLAKPYSDSSTSGGVSYVYDGTGKVVFNGTANASNGVPSVSSIVSLGGVISLAPGTYTPSISNDSMIVEVYNSDTVARLSNGNAFTISEITNVIVRASMISGKTYQDAVGFIQLELGTTPTPYVPYGQVGLEVQGRNLLGPTKVGVINSSTGEEAPDTVGLISGFIPVVPGRQYTMSILKACTNNKNRLYGADKTYIGAEMLFRLDTVGQTTNTIPAGVYFIRFEFDYNNSTGFDSNTTDFAQFELGTAATPYEPYRHTTTPIPLPSKGFAASLPDGTADALAIDSAGGYEWVNSSAKYTVTGAESITGSSDYGRNYRVSLDNILGNDVMARTYVSGTSAGFCTHSPYLCAWNGDSTKAYAAGVSIVLFGEADTAAGALALFAGAEILYPLATPTTEHGYIDLPALPEGATVSIPELREIGVSWFVSGVDELAKHAANWGARALESESRIAALEAAVATLATQ